jgi:hypothetical protein
MGKFGSGESGDKNCHTAVCEAFACIAKHNSVDFVQAMQVLSILLKMSQD